MALLSPGPSGDATPTNPPERRSARGGGEGAESAGLGNPCGGDFLWPATPRGTQLALPSPQTRSCGAAARVSAPATIRRLPRPSNSESGGFKASQVALPVAAAASPQLRPELLPPRVAPSFLLPSCPSKASHVTGSQTCKTASRLPSRYKLRLPVPSTLPTWSPPTSPGSPCGAPPLTPIMSPRRLELHSLTSGSGHRLVPCQETRASPPTPGGRVGNVGGRSLSSLSLRALAPIRSYCWPHPVSAYPSTFLIFHSDRGFRACTFRLPMLIVGVAFPRHSSESWCGGVVPRGLGPVQGRKAEGKCRFG